MAIGQRLPSTIHDVATVFVKIIMGDRERERERGKERQRETARQRENEATCYSELEQERRHRLLYLIHESDISSP